VSRFLPKSLGGQLILLLLAALTLSHLAGFLIFSDERRQAIRSIHQLDILERTAAMVRVLEAAPPGVRSEILRAVRSPRLRFWITDESALSEANGRRTERWLAARLEELLPAGAPANVRVRMSDDDWFHRGGALRQREQRGIESHSGPDEISGPSHDGEGRRLTPHAPWRTGPGVSLALSVPLSDGQWLNVATRFRLARPDWAWPSIVSMVLAAFAILLVVALSVRRITRPLKALSIAAERLGRGEGIEPLPETGPIEVRRTTAAFNAMQERLTRFVRDRTAMLAAISHDLRTPLTSLRLHAELVEDTETRAKLLTILEEMQRMTEATLAFAREEAAQEETRPVDLAALVESLCDDLAELGMDVAFRSAPRSPLSCRPVSLRRALRNIIENAVAYGHRARVSLEESAGEYAIIIDDDGPGIPEADQERVFGPFVRLEESRSRETGGIGIGKAIARSILRAHGGDITLANRPEGGLRATLHLPRDRK
jgi:signal transduction histidine kinase